MNKGYILAAGASVSWGTIPLTVKLIYGIGSANALQISFFRFLIAFLAIFFFVIIRRESVILKNKWSILMGFWGVFWMSSISFYGIQYTSAVNATILFNLNPLFVAGLAVLLKWEPFSNFTIGGVLLGVCGVILVSGWTASLHVWGDLLVVTGAFGWAVYTILGYKLRESSSATVTSSSLFWGLLWFSLVIWREVPVTVAGAAWMWIAYLGLVPTAAAFVLYLKAVDIIGSTKASVFQYLAPAVAVVISVGFGLEEVSVYQIAGVVLIVLGIELTRRAESKRK
jgi:drug/metabolite transporter (DMT)-like permease